MKITSEYILSIFSSITPAISLGTNFGLVHIAYSCHSCLIDASVTTTPTPSMFPPALHQEASYK